MKHAKSIFGCILAVLTLFPQGVYGAATLLPPGEQCFQATAGISGMVGLLGAITGGSGGTSGTYGGVALTGGSGSGATANVTVAGGAATAVAILNPGTQFVVGDSLSAVSGTIGNVVGFSVPVSSVSINSSLAGGTATFYIPNTTTFKQTWFNADQAANHQNTNPVQLDINGCAIIYGTGSYRQILKDSLGNTVWDQVTTDTSANNNTFWAGLAGGTPNAITVVDPGFNGTDGSVIQFIPISSNTGPTTLNPSGFGAISIVKDTGSGAGALAGGEIVAGSPSNVVVVVYSANQANFHILNLPNPSNPSTQQTLCGAIGLKVTNSVGTPNSQIVLTADQVTSTTGGGQTISRNNAALTLNFTIVGANGLDIGTFAASTWYNIWIIDNGSSGAVLGSLSATAPTLPSGYSYKCRLGAVQTDGSSNLYRMFQLGNRSEYKVTTASNTTSPIQAATGATGSGCATTSPSYANVSLAIAIPPTAVSAELILYNSSSGGVAVAVAPNGNYGGSSPQYSNNPGSSGLQSIFTSVMLEIAQQVSFCSGGAGGALFVSGWHDKVNAN